jgi:hypothetical protein
MDGVIRNVVASLHTRREGAVAKKKKRSKKAKMKVKDLSAKKGSGAVKGGGLRRITAQ